MYIKLSIYSAATYFNWENLKILHKKENLCYFRADTSKEKNKWKTIEIVDIVNHTISKICMKGRVNFVL